LCAKKKVAGAQRSAKKFAIQFNQQNLSQICVLKFAKHCLAFTKFVLKKSFSSCAHKKAAQLCG